MTRRAVVYVRISSDPSGQRLGVTRQTKEAKAKASALGWDVLRVAEDNDLSAYTGKRRPAYEAMLDDLEHGRADAVVVWDLDRLHRRPIELEQFLDLADRRSVALASVGGDVDLATDNGRLYARIKGAVARAEVERKSERQRSANTQRAEAGKPPGGRRAFGYSRDGTEIDEPEAAEVRKAAETMLDGGSIRGIVRDWRERGVKTSRGGDWHTTEARRLLSNPRYAGLRKHRGEVVGKGSWPPVLDEETWAALQAVLSDPARRRAGAPVRYLLGGLARCDTCGARIFGMRDGAKGGLYGCEHRRHVMRRAAPVDEFVTDLVLARLQQPDAVALVSEDADDRERATELRREDRTLRERRNGLAEAYALGEIDREALRRGTRRLDARLQEVTASLAGLARTPTLVPLVSADDPRAVWDRLPVEQRQAVIRALMTVRLRPAGRGVRALDPDTVQIEWKGAST